MKGAMGVRIVALAMVAGCGRAVLDTTTGGGIGGTSGAGGTGPWIPPANRNVDILFMVDNTAGRLVQANLERNFPTFVSTLKSASGGVLPNLHLAVITGDLGAGDGSVAGCSATGGDAGRFQYSARGTCTATNLDPGSTFIVDIDGVKNYRGNLEDVFTCIAATGNSGCGFEKPLASVVRALGADGRPAPPENEGFLRPEALLFIVLVTDEDDCSVPPGSNLFDTGDTVVDSPLGPVTSFRCAEFGHLCNGSPPPRWAPTDSLSDVVTLDHCVSAEEAGRLTPVATFVQQIQALKPDPSMVLAAAIAGPSAPYAVHWRNPGTADPSGLWPSLSHSCSSPDTSFADPAVRINQWVAAFGANGTTVSVCSDNFAPALQSLAERLGQRLLPPGNTP
jgi:hypothetical protein